MPAGRVDGAAVEGHASAASVGGNCDHIRLVPAVPVVRTRSTASRSMVSLNTVGLLLRDSRRTAPSGSTMTLRPSPTGAAQLTLIVNVWFTIELARASTTSWLRSGVVVLTRLTTASAPSQARCLETSGNPCVIADRKADSGYAGHVEHDETIAGPDRLVDRQARSTVGWLAAPALPVGVVDSGR